MKRRLTDRTLRSLKRAELGRRYEIMDVETRQFGVRVNDKGLVSFILLARFPGSSNPVRRHLGEYPAMTLTEARQRAREWRDMLAAGKDPKVEQGRQRQAELRRQADTFAHVAEAYFAFIRRKGLRRAGEIERDMRREFVKHWGNRPITDITWVDVKARIDAAVHRDAPYEAHRIFANASRLFNWAREQGTYGITSSPCDGRRPSRIIGPKEARTRVLDDDEVRALWAASGEYPFGSIVRMLLLTGQRKSEVSEARWSEFDLDRKLWAIPVARMKGKATHVVPLTDDVVSLLQDLPRFARGDHLFSTTMGAKAVNGFSKMKARFDKAVSAELGRKIDPFVLHDIRRTVRTRLSALPIPDLVRELVIGHAQKGLHKVYDQHAYLDEKRHALELWTAKLRAIIKPAPDNVVTLSRVQGA